MNDLVQSNMLLTTMPSIIGQIKIRFPVGGKIRAGIKVLTKAAAATKAVVEIYDEGVLEGADFDTIEKRIQAKFPDLRTPLVPKNVPYFTVRGSDFGNPAVAKLILEKYGEDRGDGVVRLYRLPGVFPSDAWENIMPHGLQSFGASGLKYWSENSTDGRERFCMTHEAVPVDGAGKRLIRMFGGRKAIRREENQGMCEPEKCPQYQNKHCNLSGRFLFMVPGLPMASVLELSTNSFYSMQSARQILETVGFMRGGRISGFLHKGKTFFITKKLREVAMIGDDGQPRRVDQWLIELEAPVDVTELIRDDEQRLVNGHQAAAVLQGSSIESGGTADADETTLPGSFSVDEEKDPQHATSDHQVVETAQRQAPRVETESRERKQSSAASTRVGRPTSGEVEALLETLWQKVAALQVDQALVVEYAKKKFGPGWSVALPGVKKVLAIVDGAGGQAEALEAVLQAEVHDFA